MFYGAGSWAEYCVVSETALVAVPDNVPDEIAAQFFVSSINLIEFLAPHSRAGGVVFVLAAWRCLAASRDSVPNEIAA
jgi:NADPH:quinone reductase-like Zn-dependent oxidoreductase